MSMSSRKPRAGSHHSTSSTARSRKTHEGSESHTDRRSSGDARDFQPNYRSSESVTSDALAEARNERRPPSKLSSDAQLEVPSSRRPSKQFSDAAGEIRSERRPSKRLSAIPSQAVETSIKVVVRVRPKLPNEMAERDGVKAAAGGKTLVLTNGQEQRQFGVDAVFDSRTDQGSQTVVYEQFGKDFVELSLKGYNVCIFAYGHTGSGKTYTMLGDAWGFQTEVQTGGAGLLPRFLRDIFQAHSQDPRRRGMHHSCEFYEVYNDQIRDLLAPNNAERKRKVHVHPKHGVRIEGSSPSLVSSAEEALGLLNFGNQMRTVASTTMNERSSRSHAIISFKFAQLGQESLGTSVDSTVDTLQASGSSIHCESTATFVDLAGREDQGASNNKAMQFREMCFINTSLFHLAHLITKLGEGQVEKASLTDFRNSKLTLLLSQALIGNSRTALVATVAPLQSYFEDSVSTMAFAQSVRKIQTCAVVNNKGSSGVVNELEAEVKMLRKELEGSKTNASEKEIGLLAAEALIDYYKRSYEEALSRSQEMKDARSRFSMQLGLSDPAIVSKSQVLDLFPFFTKLSDDPSLQGCCNYLVNKESLRIGSSEQYCEIVLRGLGIAPQMCEVRQDLSDGRVYVEVSKMAVNGSAPRVLVNGVPLSADDAPRRMDHNDSIILGYAHAFRLVKPTRGQVAQIGTDNPGVLARSTIPSLDMASAVAEIEEENGMQFKEVYPFLQQLSSHAPESTVASFLKALHCICPLIDEANLITREVFGGEEMRFQLYTLADPFSLLRCDVPEFAVCLLQRPRGRCRSNLSELLHASKLIQGFDLPASEHRGIDENEACHEDSDVPGKARHPLVHALGLGDHMMVDGQELLYVWSLEKFLRRLNEIREIYQEGSEARDSFAGVWQRLSKNPFLNPWTELRFADLKLFAADIGHMLKQLTVDDPVMSWITASTSTDAVSTEAAPQTPTGSASRSTPQAGTDGTPGGSEETAVLRWPTDSVPLVSPSPAEVPKLRSLCAACIEQATSECSNSVVSALQRERMSARSLALSSGGTVSALPSARSMLRDEDAEFTPRTEAAASAAGYHQGPSKPVALCVPSSPWTVTDSAPASARLYDSAPASARGQLGEIAEGHETMGRSGSQRSTVPRLQLNSPGGSAEAVFRGKSDEANFAGAVNAGMKSIDSSQFQYSPRTVQDYSSLASDRPLNSVKCDLDALRRRLADLIAGNSSPPHSASLEPEPSSISASCPPPIEGFEDVDTLGSLSQEARLADLLDRFETMLARLNAPSPSILVPTAAAVQTPTAAAGTGAGQAPITWPVVPVLAPAGVRTIAWPSPAPSPGGSATLAVARVRSPMGSRAASPRPARPGWCSPITPAPPQVLPPTLSRHPSPQPPRATLRASGSKSVGTPGQAYACRSHTGSPIGRVPGIATVATPSIAPSLVRRSTPMIVSPPVSRASFGVARAGARPTEERLDSGHATPHGSSGGSSGSLAARAWNISPLRRSPSNPGGASTPGSGSGVAWSPRLAFSSAIVRTPSESQRCKLARSQNRASGTTTPVRGRAHGRLNGRTSGFSTPAAGLSPTSPPLQQPSPQQPGTAMAATATGAGGHRWTAIPL